MKTLAIIGSTGSIGKSALEVYRNNKKDFKLISLAANTNLNKLEKQYITKDGAFSALCIAFQVTLALSPGRCAWAGHCSLVGSSGRGCRGRPRGHRPCTPRAQNHS